MIARAKGVSALAQKTGIAQNGNPEFESIHAIMHAMGYRLFLRCGAAQTTSYFHRYTS